MRAASQIYVSASIPDRPFAQRIVALLQAEGYDVHWEATELGALSASAKEAAARARCVLVIWSYSSASSRWVWEEAQDAEARKALVQIEISPVGRPTEGPCISFADWDETSRAAEWRQLMEAVRGVVGRPAGDLPVKEQLAPAAAAGMIAAVGALAMNLGAAPPGSDIQRFADSGPTPLTQEQAWAAGGPRAQRVSDLPQPSEARFETPPPVTPSRISVDVPPVEVVWGADFAFSPLRSAEVVLVAAPEAEVTLAFNFETTPLDPQEHAQLQ